ncbi:MAG: sigma-54 dependent transcriptional regulator, partial [Candidatus Micrarchaeota archaeon]
YVHLYTYCNNIHAMQPVTSFKIIGHSPPVVELRRKIERVAGTTSSVMLLGERGSGKELVARALHAERKGKFVAVNCGAIPEGLFESELFGHVRGAFTGAIKDRRGRMEQAQDGTLFLDEIKDMPIRMQVKLLRALEGYGFERVGSSETVMVNTRIICATSGDLDEASSQQRFREDLYDRLNVVTITTPALRDRLDDVSELVEYFARQFNEQNSGYEITMVSDEAMKKIMEIARTLGGNVRGLKALVERLANFAVNGQIHDDNEGFEQTVVTQMRVDRVEGSLPAMVREFEIKMIRNALEVAGTVVGAALSLGINRTTLVEKMRRYGIETPSS